MALDMNKNRSSYKSHQNMHGRGKVKKRVVRTLITITILVLLLAGAGLAYTWYLGRYKTTVVDTPLTTAKTVIKSPVQIDDTAKVGVSSQTFTDTVALGKNASIFIKTNPGAACSIRVEYNKEASTDSGLVPKKADEYGVTSWAWTVETSRPLGKWPVTVTCANAKNSGVLIMYVNVVKPE